MQKIPTLFVRDVLTPGHQVIDEWKPECVWVCHGEGVPTVKLDGTNMKIENRQMLKRQKPKERDYDHAAYVMCDRANPSERWAWEAFDMSGGGLDDGIYELVGPKIQGNPHGYVAHTLVRVVPISPCLLISGGPPRTFAGLRDYLDAHPIEGLVFHHPDLRMAKIKRRDFGLQWPPPSSSGRP